MPTLSTLRSRTAFTSRGNTIFRSNLSAEWDVITRSLLPPPSAQGALSQNERKHGVHGAGDLPIGRPRQNARWLHRRLIHEPAKVLLHGAEVSDKNSDLIGKGGHVQDAVLPLL